MKHSFAPSMPWLHTWAGLVVGWVLFVIFLSGTLACFDKELDYWMRPALHHLPAGPTSMDAATRTLRAMAPHAETLYLRPPSARDPSIHGFAFEPDQPYIDVAFNPRDGQRIPDTVGGTFFFTLHYNLQAGTIGMYLVGLAGMLMLMALISGVIIHRRIFKDIFVFRPKIGGQRAWLDGHNLTGVLGLPFHLMMAYTGVAIMVAIYMFAGVQIGYRGDTLKFYEEMLGTPHPVEQHRPPSQLAALGPVVADAERRLGNEGIEYVQVEHVHDASVTLYVLAAGRDQIAGGHRTLIYNGITGAFTGETAGPAPSYRVYQFLSGLHRVQFGGTAFRWMYFLLGTAGCVMLASGMQVWINKRNKAVAAAGLRSGYGLVRALNVGVVAGMPLASIGLLWINRLLPDALADRTSWEARGFCLVWLLAALWAWLRLRQGKPWRDLLAGTATLLVLLPVLDLITRPTSSLLASLRDGDRVLTTIDLSALVLGVAFAWLAQRCGRAQPPASKTARATGQRHGGARAEALPP
ncbi:MAG: PepSY-associated TM helix domain-containing protein [Dyella sp.]